MAISISIPLPPLFSFSECLWYLDRGYDDCLHVVQEDCLIKAVKIGTKTLLIRIEERQEVLSITLLQGSVSGKEKELLAEYVEDLFDLKRDLSPFYSLLEKEKKLAYMSVAFKGLRLVGIPDLFEALCWSIIGQQINLSFAHTLKRRLVEQFGTKLEYEGDVYLLFPHFSTIALASVESLKALKFSRQKAEYVIGVATAFQQGLLSDQLLRQLPTFELKQQALLQLRGIGIWTANYVLMKSIREKSSIPYGDAGLINALLNHHIIPHRKESEIQSAFFEPFKEWESYLVFYLWRSLVLKAE